MSSKESSSTNPDENVPVKSTGAHKKIKPIPKKQSKRRAKSSYASSSDSSDSFEEAVQVEIALAIKNMHKNEVRRIKMIVEGLRECRKKLIDVLAEKNNFERDKDEPAPPSQ